VITEIRLASRLRSRSSGSFKLGTGGNTTRADSAGAAYFGVEGTEPWLECLFFLMTSTHSTKMESAIRTAGLSMALNRGRDFVDDIEEH
jgi:hypothetical protein